MDEKGAKKGCQCEFYNGWGAIPSADGTLHFAGFAKDGDVIWQLKPTRWGKLGPVYDIGKAKAIHREAVRADSSPAFGLMRTVTSLQ
jgi:hypothetical protein